MATPQEIANGQKELKRRRELAGVDARLSTDVIQDDPRVWIADIVPPDDKNYQRWRDLKQQANDMMRKHPIILRIASGQRVNKATYKKHQDILAAWAQLTAAIASLEKHHAAELRTWQKRVIAERPQPPQKPRDIKLFGRMMTRAQLLRHELPFRTWAAIRWLANGENHVSTALVRETFSDNGRHAFTSWPNLRKQINKAIYRGYLHYSKDREQIYFASERRVALEVLGLHAVGGWALTISIEELTSDYISNRALFYAALHGSRGDGLGRPMSRQSIKQETGRGKRTQRKYERLAEVSTSRNWEYIKHVDQAIKPKGSMRVVGSGNRKMQIQQLPNSYAANTKTVKRGRRWLNQRITYLCKQFSDNGQNPPVLVMGSCGPQIKQRRYFTQRPKVSGDAARFYQLSGTPWLWQRS